MKLYLNILLIAFFSIPCWAGRTKSQTVEEDGSVKTVITDEWTEESTVRGRGNGRGDNTIVVMTNDNDNEQQNPTSGAQKSCKIKTVPLKRFQIENYLGYTYSSDQKEEAAFKNIGYKQIGTLGRVVAQQSDFSECRDLVPITRVNYPASSNYGGLLVDPAMLKVHSGGAWINAGVVGYGVKTKGKCGANALVRYGYKATTVPTSYEELMFTDTHGEYELYKNSGFVLKWADGSQDFYVWDEDSCPQ